MENKKKFYFNSELMELDKNGYPIWKNTKKPLHRYVAERYVVERKLKEGEDVHHVDGDKINFDPNNLVVLSRRDHKKIQKELWKEKNLSMAQTIILGFLLIVIPIGMNNGFSTFGRLSIWLILVIGVLLPHYPKLLRKSLFALGLLKTNKKLE